MVKVIPFPPSRLLHGCVLICVYAQSQGGCLLEYQTRHAQSHNPIPKTYTPEQASFRLSIPLATQLSSKQHHIPHPP